MAAAAPAPPRRPARSQRARLVMAIWAGLATAAILLLLDAFFAGRSLVGNLTRARSELSVGVEAIVTGDPDGALPHFEAAIEAADRASSAVGHPALELAGLLPIAGENLEAAAGVAAASKEQALAGTTMVDVARTLGWSDVGLPAAEAAGSLDIDAMEAAGPALDRVVARLRAAIEDLDEAGGDGLLGPVAAGYRDAVEHLATRSDVTTRLRDSLRLTAAMFGSDVPRRYLLAVTTLGIPRPNGGAPATVGILTGEAGRVRVESPAGVRGELAPAGAPYLDVPASPHGPRYARGLLEAAATAGIADLDGVVWIDPVGLEDLVWVTGDVKVPGRSPALSDTTTATAMEVDALLGTAPRAAAQTQARWTTRIMRAFLAHRPGMESFAMAQATDAHEGHVGIFLLDQEAQRLVRAVGLDGSVPPPRDGVLPVLATWSSAGDNHVGALVSTRIRHDVVVRPDGDARVRAEVTFENRAGEEPPSILLGPVGGLVPVGTFAADVGLLIPAGARQVEAETSVPSPIATGTDLGYGTVGGSVSVRSGTSATLTVSYVIRDALVPRDGGRGFTLRVLPQPTLGGIRYGLRVAVPDGTVVAAASPQLRRRGGALTFDGVRTGPFDLELTFA